MISTTSGYAGGNEPDPSYRHMKDYTETVRVEFDPQVIPYHRLLDLFWDSHDPTYNSSLRQYRNALFYTTEKQRLAAEESRETLKQKKKRPILTAIEEAGVFYPAEDYHQKYYLRRQDQLLRELKRIYPDNEDLTASTAAARINGYLGCFGDPQDFQANIDLLGLSVEARNYLVEYVTKGCKNYSGLACPAPPGY
ncbi:MAG: peptide-methionine (S)-S-oxide reductase [Desulfuromonadales bacterium]|nr:peptide-methionine (S)-S-oxide reductase [Desulfuromonadales bacterium]MBN2791872.1 peptide-methionine (S)-S-oxide reductase [Desulfuromonadales bacterium]